MNNRGLSLSPKSMKKKIESNFCLKSEVCPESSSCPMSYLNAMAQWLSLSRMYGTSTPHGIAIPTHGRLKMIKLKCVAIIQKLKPNTKNEVTTECRERTYAYITQWYRGWRMHHLFFYNALSCADHVNSTAHSRTTHILSEHKTEREKRHTHARTQHMHMGTRENRFTRIHTRRQIAHLLHTPTPPNNKRK